MRFSNAYGSVRRTGIHNHHLANPAAHRIEAPRQGPFLIFYDHAQRHLFARKVQGSVGGSHVT